MEKENVVSPAGIEAWLVRDTSVPVLAIEFSFLALAAVGLLLTLLLRSLRLGLLALGVQPARRKALRTGTRQSER